MKTNGYVIARNRKADQFFTSSSAYDRPKWIAVTEATVYPTPEMAQTAAVKLAKNGAYECRIVSIQEAMPMSMELPAGPALPPQEGGMEVDIQSDEEGNTEMVATDQQDACDQCEHCPCTCDHDEQGVEDIVDAQLSGDPEIDAHFDDGGGKRQTTAGDELARRVPVGAGGLGEATLPAPPPLDPITPGNKATVHDVKGAEVIKFKDPAHKPSEPDAGIATQHEDKIKVPSEVTSELKAAIAEFNKCAEMSNMRDDTRASFCMTVATAFEQLLDDLSLGTVEGVKMAQVHMTSWMNPITAHLPVSVQKFIHMGGRKPTLKDMFDDKRAEQKRKDNE